jgi:purine nucleoside phosphorylase
MGVNPLIGTPFKPMFVDMSNCYDQEARYVFK